MQEAVIYLSENLKTWNEKGREGMRLHFFTAFFSAYTTLFERIADFCTHRSFSDRIAVFLRIPPFYTITGSVCESCDVMSSHHIAAC